MNNETFSIIFAAVVLLTVIIGFIRIALRIRKHGGSMVTTLHASTYEFLSKDKQDAVEEVVEMKENKKMQKELSGEPKSKHLT